MKNLYFFLFFSALTSCYKKEKDDAQPLPSGPVAVVTTYDSIDVFDETTRLGIVRMAYRDSKIISMDFILDANQSAGGNTKLDFYYGNDEYLDSTIEHENGQTTTGDRYQYDAQKRISFRSYYHTEYAHSFLYKTDSVILKNYNNTCSNSSGCAVTPEGFSMNVEKGDTLVLNSAGDILTANRKPVVYARNTTVFTLNDIYKLYYLTNKDLFQWSMLTNRKPIESIQGSSENFQYQFDANNRVREIIYTDNVPQYSYSIYRRLVFHY